MRPGAGYEHEHALCVQACVCVPVHACSCESRLSVSQLFSVFGKSGVGLRVCALTVPGVNSVLFALFRPFPDPWSSSNIQDNALIIQSLETVCISKKVFEG